MTDLALTMFKSSPTSHLTNYESEILSLTTGCSLAVEGTLEASQGKGQAFEIKATAIKVYGFVEDPDTYPMSAKRHSIEYLREYAHLRPRTNLIGAVMRIRNTAAYAIHSFFQERGFMWGFNPRLSPHPTAKAPERCLP